MKGFSRLIPAEDFLAATRSLGQITRLQRGIHSSMRACPASGRHVTYEGLDFLVYPSVFPPFLDSVGIVRSVAVPPHAKILDVGCGSGVISVVLALRSPCDILAVDNNPVAVLCARENVRRHQVGNSVAVCESSLFDGIEQDRRFDVIVANLPFRTKAAKDQVERATWDDQGSITRGFFQEVRQHLAPGGVIWYCASNFSNARLLDSVFDDLGFKVRLISRTVVGGEDPRVFYGLCLST